MLWNNKESYILHPYNLEKELEETVQMVKIKLFGKDRVYLDVKKKIGAKGKTNNLPDGYLIDLSNSKEPKIFVVENDLSSHQHIKHIAVQILEFSLSYASSKVKVKNIIKNALLELKEEWTKCEKFAKAYGYDNVDYLLESIIQKSDSFNALLIIDEIGEELETVLKNQFNFPTEIITLRRFKSNTGAILYEFEPFLYDVNPEVTKVEISEIDTIVVAAREDGFIETFLGENSWYSIRINASMIPKVKYLATYQVAPIMAITHYAEVARIEPYKDTNKYILYFKDDPIKIKPIKLGKDRNKAPQSPRYSNLERIKAANSLDEVF